MARVVAVQVIVEFEIAAVAKIALAHVPITRRGDAMHQRAIMQHGQIKAAAVPAHQLRRVFFNQFKKFGDDFVFIAVGLAQRADVDFVAPAQAAGKGNDALQMMRHKIAARFGAALLQGKFGDFAVG